MASIVRKRWNEVTGENEKTRTMRLAGPVISHRCLGYECLSSPLKDAERKSQMPARSGGETLTFTTEARAVCTPTLAFSTTFSPPVLEGGIGYGGGLTTGHCGNHVNLLFPIP